MFDIININEASRKMKRISIAHVVPDDKFFDSTATFFDNLEGVENKFLFDSPSKNYKFKYIKSVEKVRIIHGFLSFVKELRKKDVDIVLFHRMVGKSFAYATLLRKQTKIIWWVWGYDIYSHRNYLPPIVPLEMFKPLTKQYVDVDNAKIENKFSYRVGRLLFGKLYEIIRKKAISRVDLIMPCIPIEFTLIKKNCPFFHGSLAINPFVLKPEKKPTCFEKPGNILVGNSLSYENNHLDVFEYLYRVELYSNRKYIIPVSYGSDFGESDNLIKMTHFKEGTVKWLKGFMPIDKYNSLLGTVSHAIFGVIRQQALGNIFTCFLNGVKIYLYKDSVVAQQFRRDGYVFFTIEDDLNTDSLNECLSKEDAFHNFELYVNLIKGRGEEDVYKQLCHLVGR